MHKPKLPFRISEYIKEHFREDFLFELKDVSKVRDRWVYTVEISKDDTIHTIKFHDDGRVVDDSSEDAFPSEMHEPTFGNIPD